MNNGMHGGNIYDGNIRLDFSVNTNPYGMPECVKEVLGRSAELSLTYPEITYRKLRQAILEHERTAYSFYSGSCSQKQEGTGPDAGKEPDEDLIVPGNGVSELIMALAHSMSMSGSSGKVLLQTPLFSGYERAFSAAGMEIIRMDMNPDFKVSADAPQQIASLRPRAVVMCSPCNPTGIMTEGRLFDNIVSVCAAAGSLLIVDECFLPFAPESWKRSAGRYFVKYGSGHHSSSAAHSLSGAFGKQPADCICDTGAGHPAQILSQTRDTCPDIVILRAFTKLYAMPGLRLGYAVCGRSETAQMIRDHLPEWNISSTAAQAGIAALSDKKYVKETTGKIRAERQRFDRALQDMGLETFPGEANYIFLKSRTELQEPLLRRGILIRRCDNYYGIPEEGYYRIAVRRPEENDELIRALHFC